MLWIAQKGSFVLTWNSMSFDWSQYLNLAQELAGELTLSNREARLRSSVSRAYYAAFCTGRNHLRDREGDTIPLGGQSHIYVRDQFRNSANRVRKQIGEYLNRLRIRRNKADYDDTVPGLSSMTKVALKFATAIISGVRGL